MTPSPADFAPALAALEALEARFAAKDWPAVVLAGKSAVWLFLQAALRRAGVEPSASGELARDVAKAGARFPAFFAARVPRLVEFCEHLAVDAAAVEAAKAEGAAAPDPLLDWAVAERARLEALAVKELCLQLAEAQG
ncbi:MAG TPA: hypothetical protein VMB50_10825 [Myxococcales bacterium]|nr:hypothetical protein [Myxococcales bacterium]